MRGSRRDFLRALGAGAVAGALPRRPTMAQPGERMQRRAIPATGEALPVIGMGTWQTFDVGPGRDTRSPLLEVLRAFFAAGGSVIDSSPMYGNAERVTGDLVVELGARERAFLATKVWTSGREAGIEQMEESFARLRAGTLDLMQVHNLVDWRTQLATLREWKAEGRIRYLGITDYRTGAFEEVERILTAGSIDFVQLPYSLAEREVERRLLPMASELGVAVLVMQPFASGSLFGAVRGRALPGWAAEFDCGSWAQFFLKFILGHPAVTCPLPATSNPEHMRDNVQAGFGRLPDEATRRRMVAEL